MVKNHVSAHACGTQMTGRFAKPDMLQAEAINYYGAVSGRCVKKDSDC